MRKEPRSRVARRRKQPNPGNHWRDFFQEIIKPRALSRGNLVFQRPDRWSQKWATGVSTGEGVGKKWTLASMADERINQYTFCCFCSVTQLCLTLCDPMDCSMPGFPVLHYLPELAQAHVHWVSDAIHPSHLLMSPSPPVFNLSQHIRVFSSELALCIRWPKNWSFSLVIGPSNEYSGLISFRIDWFDFLAVQGTLKSFIQYHSSKVSILWCSAFFMVQLSHPHMTTGKTIVLTRQTFIGKVMSLLFNMLSNFPIAFLPRSKLLKTYILLKIDVFIYLTTLVLVMACRIFRCGMQTLSCSMRDLVFWPGVEPRLPALEAQSLGHWNTREVAIHIFDL